VKAWRFRIAMTVAVVFAVALLVAAAAAHEPERPAAGNLFFEPAPGWTQEATGPNPPAPQSASAIAANVPLHDPPGVAHADQTVQDLPATGIVITASVTVPIRSSAPDFPERSLPLSLADADVRHGFEAQPNPDVPEYLMWQRVNGLLLDVRVFFGSQEPPDELLAEAQAELARLTVPTLN
jgi:hypothetical protein